MAKSNVAQFAEKLKMPVASLLVRRFWLPDIVPVAWAEEPQPLWAVEVAFLLRATEFVSIGTTCPV